MKTIEQIKDLMVGKTVITDLADLLRTNDADFTTEVLERICIALECQIGDVMEIIPEENYNVQT